MYHRPHLLPHVSTLLLTGNSEVMNKYTKFGLSFLVVLLLVCFVQSDLLAQCPMCRMSAESNLKNGGSAGKGLNDGILYIFVMPYLLVGIIAYAWWKNKKKAEDAVLNSELNEMLNSEG